MRKVIRWVSVLLVAAGIAMPLPAAYGQQEDNECVASLRGAALNPWMNKQAQHLRVDSDPRDTVRICTAYIATHPDDGDAHATLGLAFYTLGSGDEAVRHLRLAHDHGARFVDRYEASMAFDRYIRATETGVALGELQELYDEVVRKYEAAAARGDLYASMVLTWVYSGGSTEIRELRKKSAEFYYNNKVKEYYHHASRIIDTAPADIKYTLSLKLSNLIVFNKSMFSKDELTFMQSERDRFYIITAQAGNAKAIEEVKRITRLREVKRQDDLREAEQQLFRSQHAEVENRNNCAGIEKGFLANSILIVNRCAEPINARVCTKSVAGGLMKAIGAVQFGDWSCNEVFSTRGGISTVYVPNTDSIALSVIFGSSDWSVLLCPASAVIREGRCWRRRG